MIFRSGSDDAPSSEPSLTLRPELPACLVCDVAGCVRSWNRDAEGLLGLTAQHVLGARVTDLLVGSDGSPIDSPSVAPSTPVHVHATRAGDSARTFLLATFPLPDPAQGFVVLLWPTSTSGSTGMLPDAVAAIATRIGHDLWQMLSPVLGNVILLEDESNVEVLRSRLASIRRATETARAFAQRLMVLDPKRKPALDRCDLGRVVNDALPALRASLSGRIALTASIAEAVGARVSRKQLEQVLLQLTANAQEAMSGKGAIAIVVDACEGTGTSVPRGDWARLQVRDSGPGMEKALLEHAFEPFVSTKVPASGAGLGLPFVAAVARQHGALVDVQSRPGDGTTVSLYFQRQASDALAGSEPEQAAPRRPVASASGSILLVEDNPMVRRSVESTLRGMGYAVTAVDNGEHCLEALRAEPRVPVDLLITDVVMPKMSGKELIERVHALRPSLPVLFMSGYDQSTLASRKQAVASEHFLQKPFDSHDLAKAVQAAIPAATHEE